MDAVPCFEMHLSAKKYFAVLAAKIKTSNQRNSDGVAWNQFHLCNYSHHVMES